MASNSEANHNQLKKYADKHWAIEIFYELKMLSPKDLNLENSSSVCICQVPDSLSKGKPEAFIPKFVGLGPYHHFRDKLTLTKHMKLTSAKRILKDQIPNDKHAFHKLVTYSSNDEIKSSYHLDVKSTYSDDNTLLSILTVDSLFLLAFLTLVNHNASNSNSPEGLFSYFLTGIPGMPLLSHAGEELTKNTLIKEVFMLENQIPIQVLKKINEDNTKLSLFSAMQNFCIEHCPLGNISNEHLEHPEECYHLLDLMYRLVTVKPLQKPKQQGTNHTSKSEDGPRCNSPCCQKPNQQGTNHSSESEDGPRCNSPCCQKPNQQETNHTSEREDIPRCHKLRSRVHLILLHVILVVKLIVLALRSISVKVLDTFRWLRPSLASLFHTISDTLKKLESSYPSLKIYTNIFEYLEGTTDKSKKETGEGLDDLGPFVMIHSVTELHRAGITFKQASGGISTVKFDEEKCEFYLPCIKIDVNSEVIIRNLVAYESLTNPNSLTFTRYVEIMKAIIDTPEDVKLLMHAQIIHSELRCNVVADLFNGMGKSIRKNTKTKELDTVIEKVNKSFDGTQKWNRTVKRYTSAKFMSSIGGLVFLVLTATQTYCSVRDCSGRIKLIN